MSAFALDPRLAGDSHALVSLALSEVRLMRNASVPWLVLIPRTDVIEWCDLSPQDSARLLAETHAVARFVRTHFSVEKLNMGAIGNVVRQLHVHVVGRREDDPHWPGVVWGAEALGSYSEAEVAEIAAALGAALDVLPANTGR